MWLYDNQSLQHRDSSDEVTTSLSPTFLSEINPIRIARVFSHQWVTRECNFLSVPSSCNLWAKVSRTVHIDTTELVCRLLGDAITGRLDKARTIPDGSLEMNWNRVRLYIPTSLYGVLQWVFSFYFWYKRWIGLGVLRMNYSLLIIVHHIPVCRKNNVIKVASFCWISEILTEDTQRAPLWSAFGGIVVIGDGMVPASLSSESSSVNRFYYGS